MMNVLVTGGCGFIGRNLVAALNREPKFRVSVLDDESLGSRGNVGEISGDYFRGDVADRKLLRKALASVDVVVHLAAHTRVVESIEDPDMGFHSNVVGTFHLLEECRAAGVRRFINASTGGAILGEAPAPVHEELVPRPLSPYGATKLAAEGYCSAYTAAYGLSCVSLRFSNVYGPGSLHKGSVVAHFIKRILSGQELTVYGDGAQVRDYLFVDDLIQGLLQAIASDVTGTFQLGSGKGTALNDLMAILRAVVGAEFPFQVRYEAPRRGEIHTTWCDIGKARRDLGFNPSTSLEDGISVTWAWFRSQSESRH